ncbi:MAG: hypothetical protein WCK26_00155 [Candidatus Saccharibacteria bacterium]
MNQEDLNRSQTKEKSPDIKLVRMKRLGLAVILAAVIGTGLNECAHITFDSTSTTPVTNERIIHDSLKDNGSGDFEYIEGSIDNTEAIDVEVINDSIRDNGSGDFEYIEGFIDNNTSESNSGDKNISPSPK